MLHGRDLEEPAGSVLQGPTSRGRGVRINPIAVQHYHQIRQRAWM
jgi:hypothetical protein